MHGFLDKLGDLSWLGEAYADQGWVQVEGEEPKSILSTPFDLEWEKAKQLLLESDWAMLSDVPMLNEQKQEWIKYRKALREIRNQPGFPENIIWPVKPE